MSLSGTLEQGLSVPTHIPGSSVIPHPQKCEGCYVLSLVAILAAVTKPSYLWVPRDKPLVPTGVS